ncbi:HNH endonuclease [Streptomyces sp. NBC_00425]|uniref:HNH endonuclease n=1 Tax=Streptomyces sp. NBC_00425 TaxID=2975740 RepID=UPI002E1BEBD7
MWRVVQPKHTASDSFRTCISRVRDKQLKERLQKSEGEVVEAGQVYVAAAQATTLHNLDPKDFKPDEVTTSEMTAVYTSRMAKKGAAGRGIYDDLVLAAKEGRCPLCGQRQVSTLDHHLPKSLFPALAVDPLNLVPACSDCNKLKLDVSPAGVEDQTLHPYFDNVEQQSWLYAEVVESAPAALRFFVRPPADWSDVLARRVESHFKIFGLAALYGAQAAQLLSDIRYVLTENYSEIPGGGVRRVRQYLEREAESRRRVYLNSWQTATYSALAVNTWFCDGGFAL